MKKMFLVLFATATLVSSGCATKKFVRNEVSSSSSALNRDLSTKIDANGGEIKETKDAVDAVNQRVTGVDQKVAGVDTKVAAVDSRVTTVDGRVTTLNTQTTEGLNSVKSEVKTVDAKTERAMNEVATLEDKFESRNNLGVAAEKKVQFKFDSAAMDKNVAASLDEIADAVTQNRNAIVVLEGHTDSIGDREYNIRLGERRVEAVRRYLATEKSIPVYKIHEISFGADRPIAPNTSKEGREQNRAVTVTVLTPSSESAANVAQ